MGASRKHKTETVLERGGVAEWLRGVAGALEKGEIATDDGPLSLDGYRGVKVSFKESPGGRVRAKLSVKFPREGGRRPGGEAGEEGTLPRYSSLKKHMRQTFKAIGQALAAGQAPPPLEVGSFMADARLMVDYPGKGEEHYPAFREKLDAFEAALAAGDVESMRTIHQEMAQLKRECHSRYA